VAAIEYKYDKAADDIDTAALDAQLDRAGARSWQRESAHT